MKYNKETIKLMLIGVIFVIVFFGSMISGYGFVSNAFLGIIIAGLIMILLLKAVREKKALNQKFLTPGILPVIAALGFYIISAVINDIKLLTMILFIRHVLEFYFLFLAVLNLKFNEESFKKLNIFLFILCFVQIPAAFIKLYILKRGFFEESVRSFGAEVAAGTFGVAPGAMGTVTVPSSPT